VLTSAFLLFLLQPMLGRLLLPVFGGSPAVWNTCMVFFQGLLLAGYAYAHGSLRRLGLRRQAWLHVVVLIVSLFFLPKALTIADPASASPIVEILTALAVIAGVPFFVLSTNSSLTQRWYSVGEFRGSGDPFWLYAASNAGSLTALVAYPALFEPLFGLRDQLRYWSFGYVAFVVLSIASIFFARRGLTAADSATEEDSLAPSAGVTWRRRLGWVARAMVGSSLLLSVTMQVTSDVMSVPLLWVVPLALYLITFIVAFSPSRQPRRSVVSLATTIGIAVCLVLVIAPTMFPLWFALLAPLVTLYTGALLCHGDIAADRPGPAQLTDFYLWIAVGGMLGGVANSIVAPIAFKSLVEYPVTLICLALFLADPSGNARVSLAARARRLLTRPAVIAMATATGVAAVAILTARTEHRPMTAGTGLLRWQFMPVPVLAIGVLLAGEPGVFAVAVILASMFTIAGLHFIDPIIDQGRSFFGVSRVTESSTERVLLHGVTVHGSQRLEPALRDVPTSYYYPNGPLGWTIAHLPAGATVGLVGLGAGSLAPLASPEQTLTYFEIDPLVEQMARRDFTYLADAKAHVDVQIGDGRRLLAAMPDDHFTLLVIDAFTSDAIPTHLLTEEALRLYMRKLQPNGLLIMHISNRYADLTRVLRGWRGVTGQRVAIDQYVPSASEQAIGVRPTVAVALSRSPEPLAWLAQTKQWYWLDDDGPVVHWTDDHVNLLGVIDRNALRP